ncbi:hypothetical protein D3C84_935960 [compost metagenome]
MSLRQPADHERSNSRTERKQRCRQAGIAFCTKHLLCQKRSNGHTGRKSGPSKQLRNNDDYQRSAV